MSIDPNDIIPIGDLATVIPGQYDHLVVEQNGRARKALAPEVNAAAAALGGALNGLIAQAEADIAPALANIGYLPPVAFAAGILVNSTRITVERAGQVYAPLQSAIPFTTASTFNPAQWRLIQGVVSADLLAPTGAGLVGFKQLGAGAIPRTIDAKLRERVSPRDFGAVCDGVTDDTEAVRRCHTYANSVQAAVEYGDIDRIAIHANARIVVNTDIEFHGCHVVILGGIVASPSFNTFNILFWVEDPTCPVVNSASATTTDSLRKGSFYPTKGIFDGHGYAEISCAYPVPNRTEDGTAPYTQSFKVHRNGRVTNPLSVDLSAYNGALSVAYRRTSKKKLTIRGLTLVEGGWNNQIAIEVRRCNVRIESVSLLFEADGNYANVDTIIHVTKASDVWLDGFLTSARPITQGTGSYCFGVDGGADIYIDGMNALSGWGATGCNTINGLYVNRSHINRVDGHASAHNIFVTNCTLTAEGITYGWGGGILSVKHSQLWNGPAIIARADYGGSFFGSMIVDSVEAGTDPATGNAFWIAISLASGGALGASIPVYAPETIKVSNVTLVGRSSSLSTYEVIPVAVQVKDAASVVYAPSTIVIDNIHGFIPWMLGLRFDAQNLEAAPNGGVTKLRVSRCTPSLQPSGLTVGLIDYESARTQSAVPSVNVRLSEVDNVALRMRNRTGLDVEMLRCGVNALRCNTSVSQPTIVYRSCKFLNPAPGAGASVPIGGGVSSPAGYTAFSDCEFSADPWNLQFASALQGVLIRTGASAPVLPTDVTREMAFLGWRRPAVFP